LADGVGVTKIVLQVPVKKVAIKTFSAHLLLVLKFSNYQAIFSIA